MGPGYSRAVGRAGVCSTTGCPSPPPALPSKVEGAVATGAFSFQSLNALLAILKETPVQLGSLFQKYN